jgi:hypothetical protein
MSTPTSLPALLESFFTQRLMQQRQASPHTIIATPSVSSLSSPNSDCIRRRRG